MPFKIIAFILSLCCFYGCSSGPGNRKAAERSGKEGPMEEATGFSIEYFGGFQKLTVSDPWQKSKDNKFEYFLLEKGKDIPAALQDKQIFFTPVSKVVCLSTTHVGFLDALGVVGSVSGLSGTAYVSNSLIRKGVNEGRIREVGSERGLNYEEIVRLKPEVAFVYGIGAEVNAQINKLHDLGIPVVLVGEYLEQSPLGKAEWIRFFGAFYGRETMADSIFKQIKNHYNALKSVVANASDRPSVLTGLPFKDTWWMAGGQSNLAALIDDAGGKFLWKENPSKEAFPVSLEEVFVRAAGADFWINCGTADNLQSLSSFDSRFSGLPAVKKSQVFNNNLRTTEGGGNDYWESGVVHPDLILSDLVKIFHPELVGDKEFFYYKQLRNE